MFSICIISFVVVGAYCRPEIYGDENATKVGVLSQLKGNRGRNLDESPTSIIQRKRDVAGSEAGQKFTANGLSVGNGGKLRGDGFGGLAAGIREGSVKPAGKPYVGANGEGLLGGDGGKPSFGGLQGNHTLDLGGLDRDGGLQGGFGGLGGLGRDHDMPGGMWGGCQASSTTSTTTASTVTASTTVTGTSTTTVGGRRLLPKGLDAGLLNGGGHSDDHDHHTDDGDHADDGDHTDEIELTMTTTDAPHTYDPVDYVADKLRETDGWVLVQWPESKTGVKFPVRLLKKQRNAMAVEDVVLLYILRNGGVSEHVMTYFAGRSADEFMQKPSDIFAEKYEEFVNLLDMLWDTPPPPPFMTF